MILDWNSQKERKESIAIVVALRNMGYSSYTIAALNESYIPENPIFAKVKGALSDS